MIDLGFAISATASDASATFQKMKSVIKQIIDKYRKGQLQYGLIVFGNSATIKVNFGDAFDNENKLKRFVEAVPRASGGPKLDSALKEAKILFEQSSRPEAKKILVVLTDAKSTGSLDSLRQRAQALDDEGVVIISVGIGSDADPKDLKVVSAGKHDTWIEPKAVDSKELAKKVMPRLIEGKVYCYSFGVKLEDKTLKRP